jgi:hypothetical protein
LALYERYRGTVNRMGARKMNGEGLDPTHGYEAVLTDCDTVESLDTRDEPAPASGHPRRQRPPKAQRRPGRGRKRS